MRTVVRRRPDRVRAEWGMVLDVREVFVSRRVVADAAAGASSVALRSGSIFEGSGWVRIADRASGQVVAYTADADGVLSLADPLDEALVEGDEVFLYDRGRRAVVADFEAEVDVPEWDGAPVPAHLGPQYHATLPVGAREVGEGEQVRIEFDPDDDQWRVVDVVGLAEVTGPKWEDEDSHTLAADELAAGVIFHDLKHSRVVAGTMKAWAQGLFQEPSEYEVDLDTGIVTWPLDGWEIAGALFTFHYAYGGPTNAASGPGDDGDGDAVTPYGVFHRPVAGPHRLNDASGVTPKWREQRVDFSVTDYVIPNPEPVRDVKPFVIVSKPDRSVFLDQSGNPISGWGSSHHDLGGTLYKTNGVALRTPGTLTVSVWARVSDSVGQFDTDPPITGEVIAAGVYWIRNGDPSAENNSRKADPIGRVGVTDLPNCNVYWGTRLFDVAGVDIDVPFGSLI